MVRAPKSERQLQLATDDYSMQQMQHLATTYFGLVARLNYLGPHGLWKKTVCRARAFGQKVLQSVVKCCIDPAGTIENAVFCVQQDVRQAIWVLHRQRLQTESNALLWCR